MVSLSQWTSERSRPVAVTPTSSHSTAWFRLISIDTPAHEPSAAHVLASRIAQDTQKQAVKVCLQPGGTTLVQKSMGYSADTCARVLWMPGCMSLEGRPSPRWHAERRAVLEAVAGSGAPECMFQEVNEWDVLDREAPP